RPHRAVPLPLRRPSSLTHRRGFQLRRVDGNVLDALAFPRIGDIYDSVSALNDGRIRVLAPIAFENERGFPRSAITRDRDVQRGPVAIGVIVDDEVTAIVERHRVDA